MKHSFFFFLVALLVMEGLCKVSVCLLHYIATNFARIIKIDFYSVAHIKFCPTSLLLISASALGNLSIKSFGTWFLSPLTRDANFVVWPADLFRFRLLDFLPTSASVENAVFIFLVFGNSCSLLSLTFSSSLALSSKVRLLVP